MNTSQKANSMIRVVLVRLVRSIQDVEDMWESVPEQWRNEVMALDKAMMEAKQAIKETKP